MISRIYVALRLDHDLIDDARGRNVGVEVLAYTESKDDGLQFIETVAARDAHGRSWDNKADGDPFFDPMGPDGSQLPSSRFITWDEDLESDDCVLDRPSSVVASISVFSSEAEDPSRKLVRAYKLCSTEPCVDSFVRATTEGDLELSRQMRRFDAPPC
jgi:hypothetical protein